MKRITATLDEIFNDCRLFYDYRHAIIHEGRKAHLDALHDHTTNAKYTCVDTKNKHLVSLRYADNTESLKILIAKDTLFTLTPESKT